MVHPSHQANPRSSASQYDIYELYSWPSSASGEWNFSVLYNTSRQKAASEIFDNATSLKGLNELRQRISQMASGSKIMWFGELTAADGRKQKGTGKLAYPPDSLVQEVKKFAAERNIEIAGPFKPSTRSYYNEPFR
jgi:hypothetical protein